MGPHLRRLLLENINEESNARGLVRLLYAIFCAMAHKHQRALKTWEGFVNRALLLNTAAAHGLRHRTDVQGQHRGNGL
jgi:hypothetical protein